jgi:ribosomal protein S18 acetylase RimI-like enzyme
MESIIRPFRPNDLEVIKAITIEGFEGVSVEHGIELQFGEIAGHDWRWRKARHVDEDVKEYAAGIFVAEVDGEILGYISTRLDPEAGKGRIPNLAVAASARGQGIGRKLIGHALEYFRTEGMGVAVIETMASNPIGQSLYPSCGFEEVGRQIHYACRL